MCIGVVRNYAHFRNADLIENWGQIENVGFFVNDSYIHNPDLGFVGVTNRVAIENNDFVDNEGRILCTCGAAWLGEGTVWGNPVEYESCAPGSAVQAMIAEVLTLGPQEQGVLSKAELIAVLRPLGRAGKWLQRAENGLAIIYLQDFLAEVELLTADRQLPLHIRREYVSRMTILIEALLDQAGP